MTLSKEKESQSRFTLWATEQMTDEELTKFGATKRLVVFDDNHVKE